MVASFVVEGFSPEELEERADKETATAPTAAAAPAPTAPTAVVAPAQRFGTSQKDESPSEASIVPLVKAAQTVPMKEEPTSVSRSSLALNADHSELMSSLWAAFGTANAARAKVTQAEQSYCAIQTQLQMAMQKGEEAFVAVNHWGSMVEQLKMEQMTFASMWHEPTLQAQCQQRLGQAMQSQSFAQQSSERAMQGRKAAEGALREANEALLTQQAEMRTARDELQQVVNAAEAFLKENGTALPQDKVQPLCALCTRFTQFAHQLGASQDVMVSQGMAPSKVQGGDLHPLPDYQQRVMIVEQEPKQEGEMDELFDTAEEEPPPPNVPASFCPFFESGNCQAGDACVFSHSTTAPEGGETESKKDQLAAYKSRLMEEASYLQAVFGGRKPGTPGMPELAA
ncbi:unnamed protein product [Effrenium voratum]|nr:unnamed protein product [Effrenium voratum]